MGVSNLGVVNLLCLLTLCCALQDSCMHIDYRGRNASKITSKCEENEVCRKNFKISHINFPPYSTAGLLESFLRKCCGNCTQFTKINEFVNMSDLSFSTINESDFILPFLGSSSGETLYGYHFIPIVDVPNLFYFTPKHRSVLTEFAIRCLSLYPLMILCLLITVISGFIVWSAETWYNRKQFPRSFLSGIFEGFWFSWVSITTVGYGDRIVKSIPARLFSVIWILVGMIMFALLTSLFTMEVMEATGTHDHPMAGLNVGALKFRDYDASVITNHGGIVKETAAWNFYSDVLLLIRMLRKGEIHGFVIDKYTLSYITGYFEWKKNAIDYFVSKNKSKGETFEERREDIEFFNTHTYRISKMHDGEKLSYGVLVKNTVDYNYFRHAIEDNRLPLETSVGSIMNEQFPRINETNILSSSGIHYQRTMKVICSVLGVIFLFGLLYEVHRRRSTLSKARYTNDSEENTSGQ